AGLASPVAGSSEMPLILLMLASSVASVFAILMVIRRARQIGAA
ncbi:MAG: Bcr/CflA family drug resistance efflux transporter, partial [Rhodobacterales bacterium]